MMNTFGGYNRGGMGGMRGGRGGMGGSMMPVGGMPMAPMGMNPMMANMGRSDSFHSEIPGLTSDRLPRQQFQSCHVQSGG